MKVRNPFLKFIVIITLMLTAFTGCITTVSEPAIVDPTSLADYLHPTGAFSIKLPQDWILSDQSTDTALWVDFFSPGDPVAAARIFAMPVESLAPGIDPVITAYEPTFNDEPGWEYKRLAQEMQSDGSLRIQVVADAPEGPVQYNDFIEFGGAYTAVLRIRVPDETAEFHIFERITNSFALADAGAGASDSPTDIGYTGISAWLHSDDAYEIAGQVINEGGAPVERILVTVDLLDADGGVLTSTLTASPAGYLLPGELAPFTAIFTAAESEGAVSYQVIADAGAFDLAASGACPAEAFTIRADSGSDEDGVLVISGNIEMTGDQPARGITLAITIFGEEGRVIGVGTASPEGSFAPGDSAPFLLSFPEIGGAPATFQFAAWGACD